MMLILEIVDFIKSLHSILETAVNSAGNLLCWYTPQVEQAQHMTIEHLLNVPSSVYCLGYTCTIG